MPRIAVNVSALQLRQKDFVDSVLEAIVGSSAAAAPLLDLEITESVLVDDIDESTRKLQALRRAGVEVSVDDFGTGFCSLSYLARLPVDTLKIDRSFVVRMRDAGYPRNIVAMIVSLAHTLGLRVVAEGVEDDEQVRLLRELGCDQIQGFYVSQPVPADQIVPLLRGWRRASGSRCLTQASQKTLDKGRIGRLDQVVVESGVPRTLPVFLAAEAAHRDQHQVAQRRFETHCRASSKPSIPGSARSANTRSGRSRRPASRPLWPS